MLLKFSKFSLLASVFAVVVVLPSAFFPFIGGKDYFFRVAVETALVFYVLWWAFQAPPGEALSRLREVIKKPLFIAVSIFVLVFLLASLLAYDSHAGFWSNYERGEGGFQMLHYYAFFILLTLTFKSKEDWRRLFGASLIAAVLMILYGVFANLGWATNFIGPYQGNIPPTWWQKLVGTRFQGSLGNPAYVAPYLMFSMFYAAYLWATGNYRKTRNILFYGLTTVFLLFFFIISKTRGAFLGFSVSVLVLLIFLIIRSSSKVKKAAIIALLVLVTAGGAAFYYRNSDFIIQSPVGRLLDFNILATNSFKTRLWTWGSAWQGFLERPILGWGPENFSSVFDKYFDPRHFVPGKQTETWFDRAHNVFLDYLAETGISGFLSYLAVFAVFFYELAGYIRNKNNSKLILINALMFALPIGYLIQGLAIFDVLPTYMNLFLFFAFSVYLYSKEKETVQ